MHNKIVTTLLVVFIFAIGIGYFGIKDYIFEQEDIAGKIENINQLVEAEEWEEAEILNKDLQTIWKQYSNIVQINFAEHEYGEFEDHLNALESGIQAKDIVSALVHAKETRNTWKTLNAVVPVP